MGVHLRPLVVLVQGGPHYSGPGTPYTWAATLTLADEQTMHVNGVVGAPTLADMREVQRQLNEVGITKLTLTRVNGRNGTISLAPNRQEN